MLGLFKSDETRQKEYMADSAGVILFTQITVALEQASNLGDDVVQARLSSFFAAGYMLGFIRTKLSEIPLSDQELKRYTKRILSGIFPQSGNKMVFQRYEMSQLGFGYDEFNAGYTMGSGDALILTTADDGDGELPNFILTNEFPDPEEYKKEMEDILEFLEEEENDL